MAYDGTENLVLFGGTGPATAEAISPRPTTTTTAPPGRAVVLRGHNQFRGRPYQPRRHLAVDQRRLGPGTWPEPDGSPRPVRGGDGVPPVRPDRQSGRPLWRRVHADRFGRAPLAGRLLGLDRRVVDPPGPENQPDPANPGDHGRGRPHWRAGPLRRVRTPRRPRRHLALERRLLVRHPPATRHTGPSGRRRRRLRPGQPPTDRLRWRRSGREASRRHPRSGVGPAEPGHVDLDSPAHHRNQDIFQFRVGFAWSQRAPAQQSRDVPADGPSGHDGRPAHHPTAGRNPARPASGRPGDTYRERVQARRPDNHNLPLEVYGCGPGLRQRQRATSRRRWRSPRARPAAPITSRRRASERRGRSRRWPPSRSLACRARRRRCSGWSSPRRRSSSRRRRGPCSWGWDGGGGAPPAASPSDPRAPSRGGAGLRSGSGHQVARWLAWRRRPPIVRPLLRDRSPLRPALLRPPARLRAPARRPALSRPSGPLPTSGPLATSAPTTGPTTGPA